MNRYPNQPQAPDPSRAVHAVHNRTPACQPRRIPCHRAVPETGITALAVTFVLVFIAWRKDLSWDVPVWGGAATFCIMWVWRVLRSDALLWSLERITGRELDGKPGIGKPPHDVTLWNMGDYTPPAPNAARPSDRRHANQTSVYVFRHGVLRHGQNVRARARYPARQRGRYKYFRGCAFRPEAGAVAKMPRTIIAGWHSACRSKIPRYAARYAYL